MPVSPTITQTLGKTTWLFLEAMNQKTKAMPFCIGKEKGETWGNHEAENKKGRGEQFMEILTNPVTISVIVLCVLSLLKLNVLLAMLIACVVGGLVGGMDIPTIMGTLTGGFSGNATTALSYILLGTFATAIATTGLAEILSKKLSRIIGGKKLVLLGAITIIACLSQNLIPVHIAYIPILIPPMLAMMNRMKLDRRAAACCLAFGHKAPYIAIPFGFGLQFQEIIMNNLTENGMPVTINDIASVNWILAVAMLIGLFIAVFITYRKPREYKMLEADTSAADAISEKLEYRHYITMAAAVVVVVVQVITQNLALSALAGIMVMIIFRAIKWNQIDDQLSGGVQLMGLIAFVMLIAGGYAEVMKATGGVEGLVNAGIHAMGGNRWVAATVITLIGLLVTMGIGTSFGTVPVLAVLFVPLCDQIGFSPAATIILMSAAAALGDAGSPASDTTLGPTSGLNADGQHDHIWDTCVPTFLHFNIPLMIAAIVAAQFL